MSSQTLIVHIDPASHDDIQAFYNGGTHAIIDTIDGGKTLLCHCDDLGVLSVADDDLLMMDVYQSISSIVCCYPPRAIGGLKRLGLNYLASIVEMPERDEQIEGQLAINYDERRITLSF